MRLDVTADVVLGTIGGVLAADVALIRLGYRPITDVLRSNKRWYFLGVLALTLHVLNVLGPADPFELAGSLLRLLDV